jgi:hypothetical protein
MSDFPFSCFSIFLLFPISDFPLFFPYGTLFRFFPNFFHPFKILPGVVLIFLPRECIHAHKLVLACGSSVFYRFFVDSEKMSIFGTDGDSDDTEDPKTKEEKGKGKEGEGKGKDKETEAKGKGKEEGKGKDPEQTGVWTRASKTMDSEITTNYGRYGHTSFSHDGKVWTVGGGDSTGNYVTDMLCYSLGMFFLLKLFSFGQI